MASQLATLRKDLSAPGLIRIAGAQFSKITDTRRQGSTRFTLPDTLCAALAMFQFKWPSLNQGDNYEHKHGHGKQNLSSTLAGLMLLSFLIDQLQQHACQLYKTARKTLQVQKVMWERMRSVLQWVDIPDWETLWRLLSKPRSEKAMLGFIDTS